MEPFANDHVRGMFASMVENNETFNVFLYGPCGTGKKTHVQAFIREYGLPHKAVYELEGGLARNKDAVFNSPGSTKRAISGPAIMDFLKVRISDLGNKKRLVVIYNVCDMGAEAQNALKAVVERYTNSTLFIVVGNNSDRVSDSLLSHFTSVQLNPLTFDESISFLNRSPPCLIAENLQHTIALNSNGDLRQLIYYERVAKTFESETEAVQAERFFSVFNVPSDQVLWKVLRAIYHKKPFYGLVRSELIDKGYAPLDVISILTKMLTFGCCKDIPQQCQVDWLFSLTETYCDFIAHTDIYSIFANMVAC